MDEITTEKGTVLRVVAYHVGPRQHAYLELRHSVDGGDEPYSVVHVQRYVHPTLETALECLEQNRTGYRVAVQLEGHELTPEELERWEAAE